MKYNELYKEVKNMYQYEYKIQEEDINKGNHVGNERALFFFEEAREAFLQRIGFSELSIGENIGMIQKSARIEYKNQLYLGDSIGVKITKIEVEKLFFSFFYEIYNQKKELCIEGETKMLAYEYEKKQVKKIPKDFLGKMEKETFHFTKR